MGYKIPKTAIDLLRRGFYLFPIVAGTKDKIPVAWGTEATRDLATIERWSREDFPGCNWGIALDRSGHVVVDVDVHNGAVGVESLEAMELIYGGLPPTLEARTPSGGRHLFYKGTCKSVAHIFRGRAGFRDKTGVDTRGAGGYVVGVGSSTAAGRYEWIADRAVADLPNWVVDGAGGAGNAGRDRGSAVLSEDEDVDIERAMRYLATAPESVEGAGGDDNCYKVACMLREIGISAARSVELMIESGWNDRCSPPWDTDELERKVANAHRYAKSDQGASSAAGDFESVDTGVESGVESDGKTVDEYPVQNWEIDPLVEELNAKHAKVLLGGKVVVFAREKQEDGHEQWTPVSRHDFDAYYEHRKVEVGKNVVPIGPWWRQHPHHMRASYVTIDPALPAGPNGINRPFNLWCGWGIVPDKDADWGLIKKVIFEALAGGVREYYEYIVNWLAYCIQNPLEPARVAMAFRGGRGVGKSTLAEVMLKITGAHGIQISDVAQLTGQFNWHLRNKVFVVAEEAAWHTRGAVGVLKSLITDPTRSYESKGVNRMMGKNYTSLILNSNEDWIVPAALEDERRFAVFDVDPVFRGNHGFWREVYAQIHGVGCAGFLYHLQHKDLKAFLPWTSIPKTQALADQVVDSLDYMGRWWLDILRRGLLPSLCVVADETGACGQCEEDWQKTDMLVNRDLLYDDYADQIPGRYTPKNIRVLGKFLRRAGVTSAREGSGERRRFWRVPALTEARERMAGLVGGECFDDL